MNKKNLIKLLFTGVGALTILSVLKKTPLYFTDTDAVEFINYLSIKDKYFNVSNGLIWFTIVGSVVVTALNQISKVKKEG